MNIKTSKTHWGDQEVERHFVAYFHLVGFDCISFGFHVCLTNPNIEIHLPFGFLRIGWSVIPKGAVGFVRTARSDHTFGITE